jgi:hypothetical protein
MNLTKLFMIFLPFFMSPINTTFNVRILKAPLFGSSPCFAKHHVIIISDKSNTSDIYLLDYSPITKSNETVFMTRVKLLLGQTIQAETRLRSIKNVTNDSQIISSPDIQDPIKSKQISDRVLKNIKQDDIREFIKKMMDKQDGKMNLYTYNCQHFCRNTD